MSVLIILCLVPTTYVTSDTQVHRVFVSRKSRSDSAPIETGYMYNQVNNNPGTLSMFGSDGTTSEPVLENYSDLKFLSPIQYHPKYFSKQNLQYHLAKEDLDYAKAKSKYNANFLPSKIKSDIMYERLKSAMHYQPDYLNEMISRHDSNEYNTDEDDIRTSASGVYDNWPSYHHNPYEYEHIKMNTEVEKAKDKRYAVDSARVIPIHEDLSHDIPNSYGTVLTTDNYRQKNTDNPMVGHDPFFSFVLNDYFENNNDDDHFSFKDIHWGKDFDVNDYSRRNHNLGTSIHSPVNHGITNSHSHLDHNKFKAAHGDTATENGFVKKHDFNKHEKGDNGNTNDRTKYEQNINKQNGFKDFVDSFAKKFGSQENNRDAKYVLRRNQDNGENRKGFHRVYHKDEYQEDKEFYNNNNNSAKSEEKGGATAHIGGSEGLLSSQAAASLGNQSNTFNKAGDTVNNRFENNHTGHDNTKGFGSNFNKYQDVAKQTAQSNNADYSDNYRI